jgi:hypothetical protein
MRYSLDCLLKILPNIELRAGIRVVLTQPWLVTLLATENIEALFKRCQEKTPTCDGKKTPACDEGELASSA